MGQVLALLVEAQIEVGGGEDMRKRAEAMEQHGRELDDQDKGEEEHKHQTDRFQLQELFADMDLEGVKLN